MSRGRWGRVGLLVLPCATLLLLASAVGGSHSLGWNAPSVPARLGRFEVAELHVATPAAVLPGLVADSIAARVDHPVPNDRTVRSRRTVGRARRRRPGSEPNSTRQGLPGGGLSDEPGGAGPDSDTELFPTLPPWPSLPSYRSESGLLGAAAPSALRLLSPSRRRVLSPDPVGESDAIVHRLRVCYWGLRRIMTDPRGDGALTDRQVLVLRTIRDHGPIPAWEISRRLAVVPSTVNALTWRLVDRGLIERGHTEPDRRVVTSWITPAGREALERWSAARERRVEAVLALLGPSQRKSFFETLGRLAAALDSVPGDVATSAVSPSPTTPSVRRG